MATNPMQRQKRNSFLLGMIIALLIGAIIIVFLYMQITQLQNKVKEYEKVTSVYVLNQNVVSGQILTEDMFTTKKIITTMIPSGASLDIATTLNSKRLQTVDGKSIVTETEVLTSKSGTPIVNVKGYKVIDGQNSYTIYDSNEQEATYLMAGQKAFYMGENNQKIDITIASNVVIAKVDLSANTIITDSLFTTGNELTTNDLRKMEYNVISLPIDLMTDDYIDIRFMLPNGEDYIVLSKKRVTIPMANGSYLADTLQMNLTESEILLLSSAIIDSFQVEGSKLYATKYVEAGIQNSAVVTYAPSSEIRSLIQTDPNAVNKAVTGLRERINNAMRENLNKDNTQSKVEGSAASTLEQRRNYLQSLSSY